MRFLVDECTGPAVARWLKEEGYDVFSVYEEARGEKDIELIRKASNEDRILRGICWVERSKVEGS